MVAQADGATTTQYAAFFRSKATGLIAGFNNAAGSVFDILSSGSLRLGGPGSAAIQKGTASPENITTAAVGSTFHRTDGADSTALYVKGSGTGNSGWRQNLVGITGTATLDFPSIAAAGSQELTVTGAAVDDAVALGAPAAIEAGLVWNGFVSAANTVKIRVSNITVAAVDPASASRTVAVTKP